MTTNSKVNTDLKKVLVSLRGQLKASEDMGMEEMERVRKRVEATCLLDFMTHTENGILKAITTQGKKQPKE